MGKACEAYGAWARAFPKSDKAKSLAVTAVLLAGSAISGCGGSPSASRHLPYEIKTTDVVAQMDRVFWYDKDTVAFVGAPPELGMRYFPETHAHIYIWKPPNTPTPYAVGVWPGQGARPIGGESYLCAEHGQITYSTGQADSIPGVDPVIRDGKIITPGTNGPALWPVMTGPLGHEKRTTWVMQPYTGSVTGPEGPCDVPRTSTPHPDIFSLGFDRQYKVDFGPLKYFQYQRTFSKLVDLKTGKITLIKVPISDYPQYAAPNPWESSFTLAGLGAGNAFQTREGGPFLDYHSRYPSGIPVWHIAPNEAPKKVMIDFSSLGGAPFEEYLLQIFYTRAGYFLTTEVYVPRHSPSDPKTGLFHVIGNVPVQVLQGPIQLASVSPDGCHAAFYDWRKDSESNIGLFGFAKLSVLNLCHERSSK